MDICTIVLPSDIHKCIYNGTFPYNLKHADITLTFKKIEPLHKINDRPINILTTLSKVYEKRFDNQLYNYFNSIFSKYRCRFSIVCYVWWNLSKMF